MIPALIWLGLTAAGIAMFWNKPGHTHNTGEQVWGALIVYLLYFWGGAFESFQVADVILVLITGISLGHTIANDGEYYIIDAKVRIKMTIASMVNAVVLYYAGFFDGFFAAI